MIDRTLEPEAMDTPEDAHDYDAMDHLAVNERFVADFLDMHGPCRGGEILDVGTGPARIPILLCRANPAARVLGVDLAHHMLMKALANVAASGLAERVRVEQADAKRMDWPDGSFEAVISNTIVHHIPDPFLALSEMARLVAPGGTLFVRDLARPKTLDELTSLVETYAGGEGESARALFEASLHAALTVEEIRSWIGQLGLPGATVAMTSDRHWTWSWRRPV